MKMNKIKSSNIEKVGYNKKKKILGIQFKGGSKYKYLNVPEKVYKEFLKSESKGSYFYQIIRNDFECKKIEKKADG